ATSPSQSLRVDVAFCGADINRFRSGYTATFVAIGEFAERIGVVGSHDPALDQPRRAAKASARSGAPKRAEAATRVSQPASRTSAALAGPMPPSISSRVVGLSRCLIARTLGSTSGINFWPE